MRFGPGGGRGRTAADEEDVAEAHLGALGGQTRLQVLEGDGGRLEEVEGRRGGLRGAPAGVVDQDAPADDALLAPFCRV